MVLKVRKGPLSSNFGILSKFDGKLVVHAAALLEGIGETGKNVSSIQTSVMQNIPNIVQVPYILGVL